jgi:alkylated DNA repair protein alkB family protein 6
VEPVIPRLLNLSVDKIQGTDHIFSESPHGSPNHVLINEYLPGQGIMPHKDGSAYYPVVCTVSLGAALCLDIYGTNEQGIRMAKPSWRILQEPRSLLITTDDLYKHYLHGIADITIDEQLNQDTVANWSLLKSRDNFPDGNNERHVRTSLTYRDVLKVSKLGNKLGLLGRR